LTTVILRYASDLHLDSYPTRDERVALLERVYCAGDSYDVAVVAGDLSNFQGWYCPWREAAETLCEVLPNVPVIFVPGNHDYAHCYRPKREARELQRRGVSTRWEDYWNETVQAVQAQHPKFQVLIAGKTFEHLGQRFVGATNWYRHAQDSGWQSWFDYRTIARHRRDIAEKRQSDTAGLANITAADVVITHMLPDHGLMPKKHEHDPRNRFYVGPCVNYRVPKAWIFGHTHDDVEDGNCHARPLGYHGQKPKTEWPAHVLRLA
jgi:predicted phosphohydrolase